jgi:hypothetical protein
MDPILECRKIAQLKYQKYQEEKRLLKEKIEKDAREEFERIEKEVAEKMAEDMKNQDEINLIENFLSELELSIISIETTNDIFLSLQMIQTQIESMIELIEKHDKLKNLQDLIITLVDVMNKVFENKKHKSPRYIQDVHKIVKEIITLTKVDIEIEMMDTSDDEKVAQELQDSFYKSEIEYD